MRDLTSIPTSKFFPGFFQDEPENILFNGAGFPSK